MDSSLIILLGTAASIGFLLAVILIRLISMLPIEDYVGHPELSLTVAVVAISILAVIGFFAGFFPARRAARLQVVDSIRF